jgi:hypothetical protein
MRLDSGNRLAFAERTDCVDICLCQNRLRNEMRAVRRRLKGAGGCLGSGLLAVESVVWALRAGESAAWSAVAVALVRASDKAENTSYR